MQTTYGFFGFGLIGGSLARNFRAQDPDCRILVYSRSQESLLQAREEGVIDEILESPEDPRYQSCEYIFLCAPVSRNIEVLSRIGKVLGEHAVLTDVGSVKTGIHKEAERLGLGSRFIGGHPMTGSEKSGYANSGAHLFENAYYILTPSEGVSGDKVQALTRLVESLRAMPLILKAEEHDYITAAVSHLPHVVAASLVNTVHALDGREEHMKCIAAGGFKDITRIASSSPEMWEAICLDNHENIEKVTAEFLRQMQAALAHMTGGDGAYIHQMFDESRAYRSSFSDVPRGPVKKSYRIYCDVIDEAGAIATIATILAVHSISIRNIGIVHNREFEQGALLIEFYEEEPMRRSCEILRHHRYTVWENDR